MVGNTTLIDLYVIKKTDLKQSWQMNVCVRDALREEIKPNERVLFRR